MIDHVSLGVRDFERSTSFYIAALEPLGIELLFRHDPASVGFGTGGKPFFFVHGDRPEQTGVHVAFAAETRELVDAFYEAALAAGAGDNGAPGPRPIYHPGYYGAFVLDPDGNNVEAVCHSPA